MNKGFLQFVENNKLFNSSNKILLAVSGGIDSMAMCHLFIKSGFIFGVAHCNFSLRGKESNEEQMFVKSFCKNNNLPFYTIDFETSKFAEDNKLSIQMAARELRYNWLEETRTKNNYKYIATAHHLDDQIETIFINLMRNTGIAGLHGIPVKNNSIIRPLLFAYRKDIENFVSDNKISFRTDSSNSSDKYRRNYIRHQIIPELEKLDIDFKKVLNQNIIRFRNTEIIYKKHIQAISDNLLKNDSDVIKINIQNLLLLAPLNHYLFELLSPYGFGEDQCEQISKSLKGISGKQFFSATHRIIKDRKELIITPLTLENNSQIEITEETEFINEPLKLHFKALNKKNDFEINQNQSIAQLDFEKLKFPLTIRKWKLGDTFNPLGMKQQQKLSDFFSNNKLSIAEKENVYLLCSSKDIAWVINYRINEKYKISTHTTKIYEVELLG